MTQILITADQLKVQDQNLMITTIEDMAAFKEITIEHDKIQCNIEYVFEGIEKRVQILTVNKMPIYFLEEHIIEDLYYAIGETLIQESLDRKEYSDEQHCEENGGWASELHQEERDPDWDVL